MKVLVEHYAFIENPVWQNLYSQFLAQKAQPVQFFGYFGQQSTEVNDSRMKNLRHIVHQYSQPIKLKGSVVIYLQKESMDHFLARK